jgi:basic membrane protein A and related proteins
MKKTIYYLLLALAVVLSLMLAGCGNQGGAERLPPTDTPVPAEEPAAEEEAATEEEGEAEAEGEATAEEEAATEEETTTEEAAEEESAGAETSGEKPGIALVLDGKIDDGGWNQAAYEGLKAAEEQYDIETAYSEEVPIPDYEKALRDYANQDYDLIIAHSSISKDAVFNTAKDFPELSFLWTDGDETADNVAVIRPMAHEASYLAGLLAGNLTKSNKIGMVGGIDIPSTHRSYAAFEQGVQEANPEAEILVNWIGSFLDVAAGKEAAQSQIEAGADIIFGNGDGQNIGVLQAASESETPAIGAVRDQFNVAPNVVLTSVEWGFGGGIPVVIGEFIDGDFSGKVYEIGLQDGAHLSPYHDNADKVPEEIQKLLEEKQQEILDGKLEIPVVDFAP